MRSSIPRVVDVPVLLAAVCLLHGLLAAPAGGQAAVEPPADAEHEIAFDELLGFALASAPALQVARARDAYAVAARADAERFFRHDPSLELGLGPRLARGGGRDFDFAVQLAQPIEVAGQRGLREQAAERERERVAAEAGALRWELRTELMLAYAEAAVARERVTLAGELLRFARGVVAATERRLAAGDVSALEVRLAQADVADAVQGMLRAEQALLVARLRLCELSGWPLTRPPLPVSALPGSLALPADAHGTPGAAAHPRLRALDASARSAAARAELSERELWPTPSLGVQLTREGSTAAGEPVNLIALGTLSLPLPLWRPRRGEIARARADEGVAHALAREVASQLAARAATARAELRATAARFEQARAQTTAPLAQTLALLERAFMAGELDLGRLTAARERLLRSHAAALDAYADHARARAALESVVGHELSPPLVPAHAPAGGATP